MIFVLGGCCESGVGSWAPWGGGIELGPLGGSFPPPDETLHG